jgi:hypothetical protein
VTGRRDRQESQAVATVLGSIQASSVESEWRQMKQYRIYYVKIQAKMAVKKLFERRQDREEFERVYVDRGGTKCEKHKKTDGCQTAI